MGSDITMFEHKAFGTLRACELDGEVWFVASDVAKALGYRDAFNLTRRLDEDEKGTHSASTLQGNQEMTVINEGGLYNAVLGSKLDSAKAFKRWVTHEVLPSIRKHGGYLTDEKLAEALSDPDTIIRLATDLKAERAKLKRLQAENDAMVPKALFADAVSVSDTCILIGALAKLLRQNGVQMGQNRLFAWMRENGYLMSREGQDYNLPTQASMDKGLFRVKERTIANPDGSTRITRTTVVTGKGQQHFVDLFLEGGEGR